MDLTLVQLLFTFTSISMAASVLQNSQFEAAKLVGNETVPSLGFAFNIARTLPVRSLKMCGAVCSKNASCLSFNFVKSGDSSSGNRCELIHSNLWAPSGFEARALESSTFYLNMMYEDHSFFQIIPAVSSGTNVATVFPWNTDCLNQYGTAGFMAAMRNDREDSSYTKDFKCRVFRHSLVMSQERTSVIWPNMKCPDGFVITAVFDLEVNFPSANRVRCHKPALPWKVNLVGCRLIYIYRASSASPPSPYNDPGLNGTADSIWGAQCGNKTNLEAMVAIQLAGDLKYESIECCSLYV